MSRKSWDQFFIAQAKLYASRSKDPSTKVGCVIVGDHQAVVSGGYNGFPRGTPDIYGTRKDKLLRTIHAEVNCLLNAGRHGIRTAGTTLYVVSESGKYSLPCAQCAGSIVQAGVAWVVIENLNVPKRWWRDAVLAVDILRDGGTGLRLVDKTWQIEYSDHLVKTKD